MNYQEVEYKLSQYAQWAGNPIRSLDYPKRSIYAKTQDEIDPDALPDMSDDEAQMVGDALLALKRFHADAHTVINARFFERLNDDEIGRKYKMGRRNRVYETRMRGYSFLGGRLLL